MHVPDGFLTGAVSAGTAVVSAGGIAAALRQTRTQLAGKRLPLAGLMAAGIFVLQMLNFPVVAGTSGHLLGGALAAIVLGPWMGVLVVSVVVIVQALVFADGGLTAMGTNVLLIAVVPALVGWGVFRLMRTVTPANRTWVLVSTFVAALLSVPASAMAFVLLYAVGGQGGAPLGALTIAMLGVHVLIGVGEGLISTAVVGGLIAYRPDLVAGADDLHAERRSTRSERVAVGAGLLIAVALLVVAPFASADPDGLESVAAELGFDSAAVDSALADSPVADYAVGPLGDGGLSVALAGLVGIVATLAVMAVVAWVVRGRRASRAS